MARGRHHSPYEEPDPPFEPFRWDDPRGDPRGDPRSPRGPGGGPGGPGYGDPVSYDRSGYGRDHGYGRDRGGPWAAAEPRDGGLDLLPYDPIVDAPTDPGLSILGEPEGPWAPGEPEASAGEPVRDRIWPHLVWETVLLAACATAVLLLLADDRQVFGESVDGDIGGNLMLWATTTVLLGSAVSLSLRAAMPNLAVGAIAVAASAVHTWLVTVANWDLLPAVGVAIGGGAAVGLVVAVVSAGLGVPAWAVSLVAAVAIPAGLASGVVDTADAVAGRAPDLLATPERWLGAVAGISALGGVVLAFGRPRRYVGGSRPVGDPARRAGLSAAVAAIGALVGSGMLAAAGGLVQTGHVGAAGLGAGDLTALGLATALLGGVSAHGRRAGVFGVVFAAVLLVLARFELARQDAEPWVRTLAFCGAVLVGLVVTRLLERLGRAPVVSGEAG